MTEVRRRERPVAPSQETLKALYPDTEKVVVRMRTRPVIAEAVEPAAPAFNEHVELPGIMVTCGICRHSHESIGPLMGRVNRGESGYEAMAYRGSGHRNNPASHFPTRKFANHEEAMAFLRSIHACKPRPATPRPIGKR